MMLCSVTLPSTAVFRKVIPPSNQDLWKRRPHRRCLAFCCFCVCRYPVNGSTDREQACAVTRPIMYSLLYLLIDCFHKLRIAVVLSVDLGTHKCFCKQKAFCKVRSSDSSVAEVQVCSDVTLCRCVVVSAVS